VVAKGVPLGTAIAFMMGDWFVITGRHVAKKSNGLAIDCHLLWHHCILYDFIWLFI
jgi:hypothetical protein